jgi:hypothetical protein
MSTLLRIYREHTLELLYNPQKQAPEVDFGGLPEKAIPYVDPRVLSQDHPGFPLYLLMSAPRFLNERHADSKQ